MVAEFRLSLIELYSVDSQTISQSVYGDGENAPS